MPSLLTCLSTVDLPDAPAPNNNSLTSFCNLFSSSLSALSMALLLASASGSPPVGADVHAPISTVIEW